MEKLTTKDLPIQEREAFSGFQEIYTIETPSEYFLGRREANGKPRKYSSEQARTSTKTASYDDVRQKGKRIRREGLVDIMRLDDDIIVSTVQGDHGVYNVVLYRQFPGSWKITFWECNCNWNTYAWGRSPKYKKLEGRMCSHALATLYEAHSYEYSYRNKKTGAKKDPWAGDTRPALADISPDEIKSLRSDIRQSEKMYDDKGREYGGCSWTTEALETSHSQHCRVGGMFIHKSTDKNGKPYAIEHYWHVLPNGDILDPTSDQFNHPVWREDRAQHGMRVPMLVPYGHPLQKRYIPHDVHDPSMHDEFGGEMESRESCDGCSDREWNKGARVLSREELTDPKRLYDERVDEVAKQVGQWLKRKHAYAYTKCGQGHTHWGPNGAAGIVFYHEKDGDKKYLMQLRSEDVEEGGTWGVVGGAIGPNESPLQGALREAKEELGFIPEHTVVGQHTDDHGGWKYTTYMAKTNHFDASQLPGDWEHDGYDWFSKKDMEGIDLHPYFNKDVINKVASNSREKKEILFRRRAGGFPVKLSVVVSDTPSQIARGLMFKTYLPPKEGMLFLYKNPTTGSFWMKNTPIPLSIAFFDKKGKIIDIQEMKPCGNNISCPPYHPAGPYIGAVEANKGWFAKNRIKVGDKVELPL